MRVTIRLKGDEALDAKLKAASEALAGHPLQHALLRAGLVVAAQAQRNVTLGGTGLRVRSGRLRSSIYASARATGVRVGTNVRYAAIHEHGGTINHPGGTAYYFDERRGRAVFLSNHKAGGHNFPRTRPHPIPIQARPFLRPALDQKRFEALSIIRKVYAGPLAIGEA